MKLRHRIAGALIAVIAVAVAITAVSSRVYISRTFDDYVEGYRGVFSEQWEYLLTSYYLHQGGWDGVESLLLYRGRRGMTQVPDRDQGAVRGLPPGEELLVADAGGVAVLDPQDGRTGETLPQSILDKGTPLYLDGRRIGTLIIMPQATRVALTLEEQFSRSVAISVFWGAVGALAVGGALTFLVTGQITRPLTLLAESARRFARRDFGHRITLERRDEISDLVRAFNLMADSIERNEAVRTNLVADVSHELRTPLTILRGNLEALQDGTAQPTPELLSSLHDEVLRLGRLAHDLESVNLAEAGTLALRLTRVNLAGLVARAAAVFQHEASERGIVFSADVDEDLDSWFMDEDRIMQVLINLLANAFRFTPDHREIALRVRQKDSKLVVELRDSGPGIADEDLPFIFDRFYKAREDRGHGGSGLGLAIARSFVETHGGEIEAGNLPQGGGYFTFRLPQLQHES